MRCLEVGGHTLRPLWQEFPIPLVTHPSVPHLLEWYVLVGEGVWIAFPRCGILETRRGPFNPEIPPKGWGSRNTLPSNITYKHPVLTHYE